MTASVIYVYALLFLKHIDPSQYRKRVGVFPLHYRLATLGIRVFLSREVDILLGMIVAHALQRE